MTFRLIDRLIEDGDDHLRARKIVTRGAFSGERGLFSDYPASLILEGLAQTGGWLIKARRNFLTLAIMSRVEESEALQAVSPGSALDYDASLVAIML